MDIVTVLVGLIVGALVGTSGVGGALLLLPVLIIVLGVDPLTAVGSDAVFAALTKVGAAIVHWRQRTVDLKLALVLALGSIPGAVTGFSVLTHLRSEYGEAIGPVLERMIGILLLVVPFVMLGQILLVRRRAGRAETHLEDPKRWKPWMIVCIGFLGGTLVGLTSVGSGSIILVLLLLVVQRHPTVLVGTDIAHAVLLTGLTGTLHFVTLSSVDFGLVGLLLLGSLPGAYLGARLSVNLSPRKLRLALLFLLICAGVVLIT